MIRATTITPHGEVLTAVNVLTFLSEDSFRFQSTRRSISGAELEDSDPVLVRRVPAKAKQPFEAK